MRCHAGRILTNLRPDPFRGIEFGRTRRKFIDVQAWVSPQEGFHLAALMDWVSIPHHYDRAAESVQQMLEKAVDFLPAEPTPVRLQMQFDPSPARRDAQCPNQIQPFIVVHAGTDYGRLPARCPSAFQGTDQRKATFIQENKRRPQAMPFFYGGPDIVFPMGDGCLIASQTAALRFLATPPESAHQIPHATGTIPNSKQLPDQMRDTVECPVIFRVAICIGALF